jgi:tRNA (guanine37-N1)-methyltransferase
MKIQIITLIPESIEAYFKASMMWKAQKDKIAEVVTINLREYGVGPRKTVDDTPYGGGDGMVLMAEPLFAAVEAAKHNDPNAAVLLMTPRGTTWKQSLASSYAQKKDGLIIICGRYEGYDERITSIVDGQVSIGNYVLTGGEIAAMAVVDSIIRLLPGVLGGETSAEKESFVADDKTLEAPQFTRPAEFNGLKVPEVLLNGNHAEIEAWRSENAT